MEPFLHKRSTWTLVALVLVLGGILAGLSLVKKPQEIREKAAPATSMSLNPNPIYVGVGSAFTIDVDIDTGGNVVSAVDLDVSFSSNRLTATSVEVGDFFTDPVILSPGQVGNNSASITIGSSTAAPRSGTGTVARVNFVAGTTLGSTTVDITNQTGVAALNETGNVLTSRTGTTVYIVAPSPTPTPNPSVSSASTPAPTATPPIGGECIGGIPSRPTGLAAFANSDPTKVNLTWYGVANVDHYGIVYGRSSGAYEYGADNVGNTTNFTVSNLAPNTVYYFAVAAVNDCGNSGYSTEASVRTGTSSGGTAASATPTTTSRRPSPSPSFKPLPSDESSLDFLFAKNRAIPPTLPKVSIPPSPTPTQSTNPLISPLGGIFLIIVAVFVAIFLYRMKGV